MKPCVDIDQLSNDADQSIYRISAGGNLCLHPRIPYKYHAIPSEYAKPLLARTALVVSRTLYSLSSRRRTA